MHAETLQIANPLGTVLFIHSVVITLPTAMLRQKLFLTTFQDAAGLDANNSILFFVFFYVSYHFCTSY